MNMTKFKVLNIVASLFLVGIIQAQTVFTSGSWEDIKAKAKQENKLIFVDLYFQGCVPCAMMDQKVFPDSKVAEAMNNGFVNFKSDVFKEEIGELLSMKYAASGFPTYLFMNADGQMIDIFSGYTGVDRFLRVVDEVLQAAAEQRWLAYDPSFEMDYPDFYRQAYLARKRQVSPEVLSEFLTSVPDLTAEVPFVVMNTFRPRADEWRNFYIENAVLLAEKYGRMAVRNALITMVSGAANELGQEGDSSGFEQVMEGIKPIFVGDEWSRFSPTFIKSYYAGSKDAAWMFGKIETAQESFGDWQDQSNALAELIVAAKEQPTVLSQVEKLYLQKGDQASRFDLYKMALIRFYLQDFEQAELYANQAMEAGVNSHYLKNEDVQKLVDAAKSQKLEGFEAVVAIDPKPMKFE